MEGLEGLGSLRFRTRGVGFRRLRRFRRFRVHGLRYKRYDFRVLGFGFWVLGLRYKVPASGFGVLELRYKHLGCRVLRSGAQRS